MKASQYIYTSWKNAPNFGFSLYSKTPDVTPEEEGVISLMMRYRPPTDLPYDPTEDEIERLFPRVFAYFRLPSGRYCVAQSVYIGHEYKGFADAGRMGNFLIHAYIFDENPNFRAATFIGSDLFRRDLTQEEWTATNPPPLPQVDIPEVGKLSPQAVTAFLAQPGKKEALKSILQATTDNLRSGKPVFINDQPKEMPMWFNALSVTLPAELTSKMTFIMLAPDDKLVSVKIPTDCKPAVSNVSADSVFPVDYNQKQLSGAAVFDFKGNVISAVTPGVYSNAMVEALAADPFEALNLASNIADICRTSGLDCDKAVGVRKLMRHDFNFPSLEALSTAYIDALKYKPFDGSAFANAFCPKILSGAYPVDNVLKNFVAALYPNMSAMNRNSIVEYYFRCYQGSSANYDGYADGFKNFIPYPFIDFVNLYFGNNAGKNYLSAYGREKAKIYLLFRGVIENLAPLKQTMGDAAINGFLLDVVKGYAEQGDRQAVNAFIGCAAARGANPIVFADEVAKVMEAKGIGSVNRDWLYEVFKMLAPNAPLLAKYLKLFILSFHNAEEGVKTYNSLMQSGNYASADGILRRDPDLVKFFVELEKYKLISGNMGKNELLRYYAEYYLKGMDKEGYFGANLQRYIASVPNSARPDEAVSMYFALKERGAVPEQTLKMLARTAINIPARELEVKLADVSRAAGYKELAETALRSGEPLASYYVAYQGGMLPTELYSEKKKSKQSAEAYARYGVVEEEKKSPFSSKPAPKPEGQDKKIYEYLIAPELVENFVPAYMDRVILLADGLIAATGAKRAFERVFEKIIVASRFSQCFIEGLENVRRNYKKFEAEEFVGWFLIYAAAYDNTSKGVLKQIGRDIMDQNKWAKKDSVKFALENANAAEKKALQQYIDEYNAQSKGGFFSRLFGKKKSEEQPEQPQNNPGNIPPKDKHKK